MKNCVSVRIPFLVEVEGEVTEEKVAAEVRRWFVDIKKRGVMVLVNDQAFKEVEVSLINEAVAYINEAPTPEERGLRKVEMHTVLYGRPLKEKP